MVSSSTLRCKNVIRDLPFVLFWCVRRTRGKHTSDLQKILCVEAEAALRAIGEPVAQGRADGAKRDFFPGNARFLEQRHLQGLLAGLEAELAHPGPVVEVDLVDARHRDHRER